MYVFHVNYKKMKNYNATNLLQKNKYKNVRNITTTDSRISHTLRTLLLLIREFPIHHSLLLIREFHILHAYILQV